MGQILGVLPDGSASQIAKEERHSCITALDREHGSGLAKNRLLKPAAEKGPLDHLLASRVTELLPP